MPIGRVTSIRAWGLMPKKYTNTGGHSKAFTPPDRARSRQYALKDVPARLWLRVQAKAKARKISIRALILGLLTRWLDGDIDHPKVELCECVDPSPVLMVDEPGASCRACGGKLN